MMTCFQASVVLLTFASAASVVKVLSMTVPELVSAAR